VYVGAFAEEAGYWRYCAPPASITLPPCFLYLLIRVRSSRSIATSQEALFDAFLAGWLLLDPDGTGRIASHKKRMLLSLLPPPLGFSGQDTTPAELAQRIRVLAIPVYGEGGYVTMHQMLEAMGAHAIGMEQRDVSTFPLKQEVHMELERLSTASARLADVEPAVQLDVPGRSSASLLSSHVWGVVCLQRAVRRFRSGRGRRASARLPVEVAERRPQRGGQSEREERCQQPAQPFPPPASTLESAARAAKRRLAKAKSKSFPGSDHPAAGVVML